MQGEYNSDVERKVELVKELLAFEPFHAFEIRLTDGSRFEVSRPYSVAIGERGMAPMYRPRGSRNSVRHSEFAEVNVLAQAG